MRWVLFGSTGFIGRHLVRALAARGVQVILYSRRPWGLLPPGVTEQIGPIDDLDRIKSILGSADGILYLAWMGYPHSGGSGDEPGPSANVRRAESIFELAVQEGVRRVVFLSSGGTVYGEPLSVPINEDHPTRPAGRYGKEKLEVEGILRSLVRSKTARGVVLRPSTVFGPGQRPGRGQGLITTALDRLRRGDPIEVWGSGQEVRDYLFIDDLVKAMTLLVETESPPEIVNLGSGTGMTVLQVLDRLAQVTGLAVRLCHRESPGHAVRSNVLDCARAREVLGWRPAVSLDEGLARTWEWIRSGCEEE